MSARLHSRISKYAFEMISIVLGVLVALGVDEWNEDRQNTTRAESAISNIQKELQNNQKILEILHPQNLASLKILQEKVDDDTSLQILPGLQLQKTAWETMQNSGVSAFVEYEKLFEIAQIYSIQDIYVGLGEKFIEQYMESRRVDLAQGRDPTEEDVIFSSIDLLELMVTVEGNLYEYNNNYLQDNDLVNGPGEAALEPE